MAASDDTHLAQFGTASLWPVYAFPGNVDTNFHLSPHSNSDRHWAYIPSLPAEVRDFVHQLTGEACSSTLFTHCKRELVQSIWRLLLDEDFWKAYKQGIVVKCADGITRRVYIRLFTYSADYPEKMLMLSLHDQGNCVCPRCLLPKELIHEMGMKRDLQRRQKLKQHDDHAMDHEISSARSKLYGQRGLKITSEAVDGILKPTSHVPTIKAFSEIIPLQYFNKYQMFVVNLLHEFELGVWKVILVDLIRIMTKVGQEATLERLELATSGLGTIIRKFAVVTCPQFDTEELGREFEAHKRRLKNQDPKNGPLRTATTMSKKKKSFNLQTPKFHFLGD
ncbi:hypothetical protein M422DRAFT_263553 [Sphaerobolus stellatus SS14]|uniref:Uncharacterized protein n=1 Tax=Sphaerobolus stellatus (strain SS14) TaxID=990650 RepID=A0A0C9UHV6_SPHS4|nr:hypothetical protein M422DRAFT_263553 [Sphaerobolus stellatus SS14]